MEIDRTNRDAPRKLAPMIDARAHLAGWIPMTATLFTKDLNALSQEQCENGCGSVSRSPRDLATEIAMFTRASATVVRGGDMPQRSDENYQAEVARLASPALAGEAVMDAANDLSDAVANASDEDLNREIMMPWGQPMSVYAMAHLGASHIMYHDGQLCYVQSLHGDAEMHWF